MGGDGMSNWENRIKSYGTQAADQFLINPSNARKHPEKQRQAVKGSLDTLGWVSPVIINANSGYLVDGHERLWQALSQGDETIVPYIEIELSPEEEAQFLLTFDYITYLAEYDRDMVQSLMSEMNSDNEAIQKLVADMAQEQGILLDDGIVIDAEPQIDLAHELQVKWQTARGQVWEIPSKTGNFLHRVMCGDSTSADDVAKLMGGKRADMMFTDPPYGISFVGQRLNNTTVNGVKISTDKSANTQYEKIENDELSGENLKQFCFDFLKQAKNTGIKSWYICFAQTKIDSLLNAMRDLALEWRSLIAWVKNESTLSAKDYKIRYEPIVYGQNGGAFYGERYHEEDVWEITRTLVNDLHPTMKPVELVMRAIKNSSLTDNIIIDPFLGSGTTIIACEQTGRIGYGMEISPQYLGVILQRLTDIGLTPKLCT
jgi:DNA modification methylase